MFTVITNSWLQRTNGPKEFAIIEFDYTEKSLLGIDIVWMALQTTLEKQ
jgi:hypothetical protein